MFYERRMGYGCGTSGIVVSNACTGRRKIDALGSDGAKICHKDAKPRRQGEKHGKFIDTNIDVNTWLRKREHETKELDILRQGGLFHWYRSWDPTWYWSRRNERVG